MEQAILYTPFLRFSGSREADSHLATQCVDIAGAKVEASTGLTLNYLVAPFECTVKYINRAMNSVFFESVTAVTIPSGQSTIMSFRCAHMNDSEWDLLKMYVGRKFYQGEVCYFEGYKGLSTSTDKHIHIEFGKGTLTIPSGQSLPWFPGSKGNYTISTTNGALAIELSCYLHQNVIMEKNGNPADKYSFKYNDTGAQVTAETYTFRAPTSNCNMKLTVGPYTMRNYPGGAAVASNFVFNAGSTINILGFQPIKHTDGKYYYRAKGTVSGVTKIGYMQYDPEEVYPTGTADKLFMKVTQASRVRTSMDTTSTTNIVTTLQPGDLQKPAQFINCAAGDHNNGWVRLQDGNYMQYDTDCMYPFGTCKF